MQTVILSLLFLSFVTGNLHAAAVRTDQLTAELVAEKTSIQPGESFTAALKLDLLPHWHVYWINPGDSGLPPELDWDAPEGFSVGKFIWPFPENIPTPPLATFGYEGTVYLPVQITAASSLVPGSTVVLQASASWLVCKEICLPGSADLSLSLEVTEAPGLDSPSAEGIRAALQKQPVQDHDLDLNAFRDANAVRIWIPAGALPEGDLHFFPFVEQGLLNAAEQTVTVDVEGSTLSLSREANALESPERLQGVLVSSAGWTGLEGRQAIEVDLPFSAGTGPVAGGAKTSLLAVIATAFLGGLILNLMPCVFPVLGLKIMGFVEQAGSERKKIVAHGLWFAFGVLTSFWILAGALIAVRAGGAELGWGFQLQSPMFVFFLALLLFLFALNLSGLFEVGTTLTSVGGGLTEKKGYSGSFFSGILATLVATPCAAPFLAPALGAALALPASQSMLVFTFVALGLSTPYLLLSAFPALIEKLPRPGAWMETFKQAMAFLLYGTVAYLVWVLLGQVDDRGSLWILFSLVIASLAAWIYGRYAGLAASAKSKWIARIAAAALLLVTVQMGRSAARPSEITWEKWAPGKAEEWVAKGRTVYVDFTARWCATCQVNKRVVFGSDDVIQAFVEQNVIALKADWTNQDPEITRALASYKRSAVPFNLIYRPDREDPILLPELLTPGIVLEALNRKN